MPKELETMNLNDIEILAVGTWTGSSGPVEFRQSDLDDIVAAFDEITGMPVNYEPPAKLGHDGKQKLLQEDGYPAAGWITRLRRVGDKLVADLKDIPGKIAAIIKAGGYKKVSAEVYSNYEISGKKFPKVLKAISFLGGDIPAVKTLNDIVAQYKDTGQVVAVLYEMAENDDTTPRSREVPADQSNPTNTEQEEYMEKELREVLGLAEDADIVEAVKGLKEKADAAAPKEDTVSLSEHETVKNENSKLETRVTTLETQLAERDRDNRVSKAIVAGKITPAQKEWADQYALSDPSGFDAFVAGAPVVVDLSEKGHGKDGETEVELTEADIKMAEQMGVSREALIEAKKQEVA